MRSSGVILHITSLPSRHGIGDMGVEAYRFVRLLNKMKMRVWEILPMGPVDDTGCPYTNLSAFAGNPLLIDLDTLSKIGLIPKGTLPTSFGKSGTVDYPSMHAFKDGMLRKAFSRFRPGKKYSAFLTSAAKWLDDWAMFMALAKEQGNTDWVNWPKELRDRHEGEMKKARVRLKKELDYHRFVQFIFFEQWHALRKYANQHNVLIMGDIPIFVSMRSADVWARPYEFNLDEEKRPYTVAGCPPDAFSSTGQRWGLPHYRWDVMQRSFYDWWCDRFAMAYDLYDIVRIDHFRGFEAYWEIPAWENDAKNGWWVRGHGWELFGTITYKFGGHHLIAEDLGHITPEVHALREYYRFPGMKVFQMAFGTPWTAYDYFLHEGNDLLPHKYQDGCVAYTGTHDNNTIKGWFFGELVDHQRHQILTYTQGTPDTIHWNVIKSVFYSRAYLAMVPFQDLMGLGAESRFNTPGISEGNWQWRLDRDKVKKQDLITMRAIIFESGRGDS